MTELLIVYYSSYGHVFEMAKAARDEAKNLENVNVKLVKVPEFESAKKAMSEQEAYINAQKKQEEISEVTQEDLKNADGILWGIPTRFGNMPAQVKQVLDTSGGLWANGDLEDTVTGIFTSSNTLHGGQESTILSSLIPMLHLGMIFVGTPYGQNPELNEVEFQGGSPYGPSTVAGPDGSRFPNESELKMVKRLAARVTRVAKGINQ